MAFDVSALTDYVNEHKMDLIRQQVASGKLANYATIQDEVRGSTTINLLSSDVVFQADNCDRQASATTTLTQRTISPGNVLIAEDMCMLDLRSKYTNVMLASGLNSSHESNPFEQLYLDEKISKINKEIEIVDWKGDVAGAGNLAMYDGLIKLIDAAGTAVDGNTSATTAATGITAGASGNVIDLMTDMAAAQPADVVDSTDLVLWCGLDTFLKYQKTIADKNLFHYVVDGEFTAELPLIGFPHIKVVGTVGLSGTDRMFLCENSNIYIGVDLLDEQSTDMRAWYDDNTRLFKYSFAFTRGINCAFPDRIIEFTLVP
jgi:hypothetical protein